MPPPNLGQITQSPVTNGQVTLTGSAGSVEGNAQVKVTNTRTNQVVTVTANANGSFTTQLGAQNGDNLTIVVTDSAGNVSPVRTLQIAPAVQVAITAPTAGVALQSDRTIVRGTVQGPPNTGVTVNGLAASIQGNQFLVNNVPVTGGSNTLTATATTPAGQSATTSLTVTSSGTPSVLTLAATPDSGISSATAPLPVLFTYQLNSAALTQSLSMDFDGDGTFEITNAPPDTILSGGYSTPGIYVARLQVTDQQGQVTIAEVGIVVQDVVTMDALVKSLWNSINTALLAGDKATALTFLTARAREKYGPVFDALLPHMAEVVATFTEFQGVNITSSYAEYALNATINGENRLFLIYFLKDADGVWRLEAM